MYHIINCIVLRKENYDEYDRLVTVYSLEFGKLKLLFKSVNKPQAKLICLTEPGTEEQLYIYMSKYNTKYRIRVIGGKLINFYSDLKSNLLKYLYTSSVLEIVDSLTLEFLKDDKKYFLLKRVLELFSQCMNYELIYLAFILRFIKLCGYGPEIYSCIVCKNRLLNYNSLYFSMKENGIICPVCIENNTELLNNTIKISYYEIFLLQKFLSLTGEEIDKLNIGPDILVNIKKFLFEYLQKYVHFCLKTYTDKFLSNLVETNL